MTQLTLAAAGFESYAKTTRRTTFLAEMERIVPWSALRARIEPFYPKPGNGGKLHIYFLQQWFNVSDPPVEETLCDPLVMRRFVGIDLGEPVSAETTVCRFRHVLQGARSGAAAVRGGAAAPRFSGRNRPSRCTKSARSITGKGDKISTESK